VRVARLAEGEDLRGWLVVGHSGGDWCKGQSEGVVVGVDLVGRSEDA
jgi:hypothetical protein